MPPPVDPAIHRTVRAVYTTDLGLPEEWTTGQRTEFIRDEADRITWMARAHAATLSDLSVSDWTRRNHGQGARPTDAERITHRGPRPSRTPGPQHRTVRTHHGSRRLVINQARGPREPRLSAVPETAQRALACRAFPKRFRCKGVQYGSPKQR
jgi:hypothetical protein